VAASSAGHTIGTAWVQVALSTKAISQQLKEALGDVDTKPAERKITSGLGGAFIEGIDGTRATAHPLASELRKAGAGLHPQGLVVEGTLTPRR